MITKTWFILLLTSLSIQHIQAECAFTQHCYNLTNEAEDAKIDCDLPVPTVGKDAEYLYPVPYVYQDGIACENFKGKNVCCNTDQNFLLNEYFKFIDETFGPNGGGFDLCASNIKSFFCQYTCSPYQNEFTFVKDIGEFMDILAREMNVIVNNDLASTIYQSCNNTFIILSHPEILNYLDFFKFLAENSLSSCKWFQTWINFEFASNNQTTLDLLIE